MSTFRRDFPESLSRVLLERLALLFAILILALALLWPTAARAQNLRAMTVGTGTGTITSLPSGINCGADCNENFAPGENVTLTATPAAGSVFAGWAGDCIGNLIDCEVPMDAARSVRARFLPATAIPTLTDVTPAGLAAYLAANPTVNTPARFIQALPVEYKRNWLMMSRSESLQTGTAETPRFLLPSADMRAVFTFGLMTHSSYPGAHPNAIEYMQWDPVEKNFRFHEIVLAPIPAMGVFPARGRGVAADDARCSKCHSTNNVLNTGSFPGTTGFPIGLVKAKNKPNWDSYDSWGGLLPFNRDRIYKGTVEAAAFRRIHNPWTWATRPDIRAVIEQLELQPPGVPAADVITRTNGGANDGHVSFAFDGGATVLVEPAPTGTATITATYAFNGVAGSPPGTAVARAGAKVTLHHSGTPTSDEGRAVQFFDILGGLDSNLNQQRIADEVASHRFATGSVPMDARPLALAIAKSCLVVNAAGNRVDGTSSLTIDQAFFAARTGLSINQLVTDTRTRAQGLTRRKADIEKINLDRTGDVYLDSTAAQVGLIQQYGAATTQGTDIGVGRLRQDVFRRPNDAGVVDATVMGGIYVDREDYPTNTEKLALFRFFLEPLGVSVDKWSMGVRGRSRTYTFADVFGTYLGRLTTDIQASLTTSPIAGLASPYDCASLITTINASSSALPSATAVPTYTDIQRIFNKSCIECHGGLDYPPFSNIFDANYLDLSENEDTALGDRLTRPYDYTIGFTGNTPATSYLYQRITETTEECPNGVMPCGGPPLSKTDIESIRRWIVGARPYTNGDPHIRTVDGTHYDFQSAGEFVLLRGQGIELQARQSPVETQTPLAADGHTGLSSCVSINTAAAIRVGPHRISYVPNLDGKPDRSGMQLRVDGQLLERLGARGFALSSGGRILPTSAGGVQIEYPGGTDIVLTPGWWDHHQVWYLNIDVRYARATDGVMGAVAPRNWLPALPDGSFLGPRPASLAQRYADLYERFADAWRVTPLNTLFDYGPGMDSTRYTVDAWPGQAPQTCRVPRGTPGVSGNAPAAPLPIAEAKKACRAVVDPNRRANCEADVMVTGEAGFATTYLQAEKIQRNVLPTAPVLTFPANDQSDVDPKVTFTWQPTVDGDQGKLTYVHCVWATGSRLTFKQCQDHPTVSGPFGDLQSPGWWWLLLALLVLVLILIVRASKGRLLLIILAIVLLLALLWLFLSRGRADTGTTEPMTRTVTTLEPGKAYFWKVIAEDGQGGTVESETRRFATKK